MEAWLAGMSLGESLGEIAGLLLVFAFILFLTYQVTRWIARYSAGQVRPGSFQVIETYKLAPNRYLQIVRVAGRYLVLAVSKDQISLLTELSEEELYAEKHNLDAEYHSAEDEPAEGDFVKPGSIGLASGKERHTGVKVSFQELLERLAKKKQDGDKK